MIIAVSDLHMGDPVSNKAGFKSFIEEFLRPRRTEISHLVLLGDILDLWRRNNSHVILENLDVLNDVCSLGFKVHYIVGNHDFIMNKFGPSSDESDVPQRLTCDPNTMIVSDNQLLENGGKKFRFIHGHQMSYWYALPFYEAFSCAMCEVNEDLKEISDVWRVLERHACNVSPHVFDNIQNLPKSHQHQIEKRLAGPLVGDASSFEESIIKDYALLRDLVEFEGCKTTAVHSIVEEIHALSQKSKYFQEIKSARDLEDLKSTGSFEEVAGKFVHMWIDTIEWLNSNRNRIDKTEYMDLVGPIRRISAMFCTDLQPDEFLIHGHGHNSYVDGVNQMADCGCWINNKASYIAIEDGEVTCIQWPKQ